MKLFNHCPARAASGSKSFASNRFVESLERRQLLSAAIVKSAATQSLQDQVKNALTVIPMTPKAITVTKTPVKTSGGTKTANTAADAAPQIISWINRSTTNATTGGSADTDGFGATFGTMAPTARAVVDAVIVSYEQMIISFNYPSTFTYQLTLSMNGAGFGASAGLSGSLGSGVNAKPASGTINMGKGNNTTVAAGAGTDQGWFLDPTPFESSEFQGNITNAFSGDAPSGSPAYNKGDFFTVVAAEMTHCMGQFGSALSGWTRYTTNTTVSDSQATGKLWVFSSPSVKHLMTSDNGGTQDFGSAIHTAEPQTITYSGTTYVGAQDQGNAIYEFSRRYMIDWVSSLEFKDAYGYSSINPAIYGTTYASLNSTTGNVLVRGGDSSSGHSNSADVISITRSGNTITFSSDIGNDVGGTGTTPGNENLPAWVTQYDISQVQSITLNAGDGNDTITIGAGLGVPVTLNAGAGTDSLTLQGTTTDDNVSVTGTAITGSAYNITYSAVEALALNTGSGNVTVNFNGSSAIPTTINGGSGTDIFNLSNVTGTAPTLVPGSGPTTINLFSNSYTLASDIGAGKNVTFVANGGSVTFTASQHLTGLSVSNGGSATLTAGGAKILTIGSGGIAIDNSSTLDLSDNDLITAGNSLASVGSLIASARNGGAWTGSGLTSTNAKNNSTHNTTLGAITGSEYASVYGGSATFDGQPVSAGSILVKYTYNGDADFSGTVNADDYGHIDSGYQNQNNAGFVADWFNGNFDYNNVINADDYGLIDAAYQTQSGIL